MEQTRPVSRVITGDALLAAFKEKGWKVDNRMARDSAAYTKLDLDEFTILPQGDQSLADKLNSDVNLTADLYAWVWGSNSMVKQRQYEGYSAVACYVLRKRTPLWHELE